MSGTERRSSALAADTASKPAFLTCDAYLFDIDGTLLNTHDGVHYHAFQNAVRDVFGIELRIDGVPVHGNTDIGILRAALRRAGLADERFEAEIPAVLQHMCAEVSQNADAIRLELCPSALNLLEALRRAGKLLGVVSGNLETIGWLKLKAAGLADFFAFGCFSDVTEYRVDIFRKGVAQARKMLGSEAPVCVVGDTPSDVSAAREAGIPVIAVATGIFSLEHLKECQPDLCIACCTELLNQF